MPRAAVPADPLPQTGPLACAAVPPQGWQRIAAPNITEARFQVERRYPEHVVCRALCLGAGLFAVEVPERNCR